MVMIQPAVESFYNLVCGIFINLENWVAGELAGRDWGTGSYNHSAGEDFTSTVKLQPSLEWEI